jgi:hypothetical protein
MNEDILTKNKVENNVPNLPVDIPKELKEIVIRTYQTNQQKETKRLVFPSPDELLKILNFFVERRFSLKKIAPLLFVSKRSLSTKIDQYGYERKKATGSLYSLPQTTQTIVGEKSSPILDQKKKKEVDKKSSPIVNIKKEKEIKPNLEERFAYLEKEFADIKTKLSKLEATQTQEEAKTNFYSKVIFDNKKITRTYYLHASLIHFMNEYLNSVNLNPCDVITRALIEYISQVAPSSFLEKITPEYLKNIQEESERIEAEKNEATNKLKQKTPIEITQKKEKKT